MHYICKPLRHTAAFYNGAWKIYLDLATRQCAAAYSAGNYATIRNVARTRLRLSIICSTVRSSSSHLSFFLFANIITRNIITRSYIVTFIEYCRKLKLHYFEHTYKYALTISERKSVRSHYWQSGSGFMFHTAMSIFQPHRRQFQRKYNESARN